MGGGCVKLMKGIRNLGKRSKIGLNQSIIYMYTFPSLSYQSSFICTFSNQYPKKNPLHKKNIGGASAHPCPLSYAYGCMTL